MKKFPVDVYVDDNDGEAKVIELMIEGKTFYGTEPYQDEPGVFNLEFILEDGEDNPDNEVEDERMELLKIILTKNEIPFKEINPNEVEKLDNTMINIQINKDYLDITWDEE